MRDDDLDYLRNYTLDKLYTRPTAEGCFATMVTSSNEVALDVGEIVVSPRVKIAVRAFYINNRQDYNRLEIIKFKTTKPPNWELDSSISINRADAEKIRAFASILASLNPSALGRTKVALGDIQIEGLTELLRSSAGKQLLDRLSNSPDLQEDIVALEAKREALKTFEGMLYEEHSEADWQLFFEKNSWIFGHGLRYVFLTEVGPKLEAYTTGADFATSGKRTDTLLRTRAEVSQFVLVEIKKNNTDLLSSRRPYRSGCWAVSDEVSGAVTQIQKTTFEFTQRYFRHRLTDDEGNDLPDEVFAIQPDSYLVIGNLSQLASNTDKLTCFELYRKSLRAPTIITFDELFDRAKFILQHLSKA